MQGAVGTPPPKKQKLATAEDRTEDFQHRQDPGARTPNRTPTDSAAASLKIPRVIAYMSSGQGARSSQSAEKAGPQGGRKSSENGKKTGRLRKRAQSAGRVLPAGTRVSLERGARMERSRSTGNVGEGGRGSSLTGTPQHNTPGSDSSALRRAYRDRHTSPAGASAAIDPHAALSPAAEEGDEQGSSAYASPSHMNYSSTRPERQRYGSRRTTPREGRKQHHPSSGTSPLSQQTEQTVSQRHAVEHVFPWGRAARRVTGASMHDGILYLLVEWCVSRCGREGWVWWRTCVRVRGA